MNKTDAASFDEYLAGGIFSSPETRTNLEILCDDFGSCFAGTPGEEEAALFLEGKLREYGLENVRTEPFEYNGWTRGPARLSMTSPRQRDLESLSMPMAAPGLVRGRVVDLGYGAPEDFEARRGELAGNIALVAGTNPPGSRPLDPPHRRSTTARSSPAPPGSSGPATAKGSAPSPGRSASTAGA